MLRNFGFFLLSLLVTSLAWAQTSELQDIPLTQSEVSEIHDLLDQVKNSNPPQNGFIRTRAGLIQLIMNTATNVKLSPDNILPAVGAEGFFKVYDAIGIEGSYVFSQVYQITDTQQGALNFYKVGPRYTFFLDQTNLSDFFALKLFYHSNTNTFKPLSASALLINNHQGYAFSIERSIPASRKIGILASLDLIKIDQSTATNTIQGFSPQGVGFEFRGELFYNVNWFNIPTRIGLAYWQLSYANELGYELDNLRYGTNGRHNYFQITRAVWTSLTLQF